MLQCLWDVPNPKCGPISNFGLGTSHRHGANRSIPDGPGEVVSGDKNDPMVNNLQQRPAFIGSDTQSQGVEFYKALRVRLVVGATVIFKRGNVFVEQAVL